MVVGSPELRTPPATGGESITDLNYGVPQPVQWTCPRSNYDVPSYPANSDGLHGVGIQDPGNKGAGVGFPDENCDGYASPLRADIHFPSCYNPAAGLDDYKNNMQFPSSAGASAGKANCPQGWIHTPHLFYEVYWNTPLFVDMWTQGQGSQPFVLSNGDPTGYSLHADFVRHLLKYSFPLTLLILHQISGWDVTTLQQIIDNCDAGDSGMDKCPGLIGGLNDPSTSCNIPSAIQETITGELEALPGNNPVTGWGTNVVAPAAGSSSISAASSPSASAVSAAGSAPASAIYPVSSAPASAVYPVSSTPASISPVASSAPIPVSTTGYSDSDSGYGDTGSGSESSSGSGSGTIETSVSSSSPATATNSPSTPSATGNGSAPAGWSYYGCYSDSLSERVLTGITFANLGNGKVTSTGCVAYCEAEGYSMAGTEYAGQCFCGNYLVGSTLQADSLCNMKCEGDPTQICGGSLTLSVYKKSNSMRRRHMHLNKHLAAALKV